MWNVEIWETRYKHLGEKSPGDTMSRVASAMARGAWDGHFKEFLSILERGEFVPGGRILANAGTPGGMLLNCFNVPVKDSRHDVFRALTEGIEVLAHGGGVGFNFSPLRAAGSSLRSTGGVSQGPIPFIDLFDQAFNLISKSYEKRQAAAIAVLSVNHPDVIEFIRAKRENTNGKKRWTSMNVSVDIDEPFINKVLNMDEAPDNVASAWEAIVDSTYACGDPGFVFLDRARSDANQVDSPITGVNPCGEVPLPDYGACCLGSINLSALVVGGRIDHGRLGVVTKIAVDFLTSVLFVTEYPGQEFRATAYRYRRIGLGVTGLAHALIKCGYVYGSEDACMWIRDVMNTLAVSAYQHSARMAIDAGAFEPISLRTDGLGFFNKDFIAPHLNTTSTGFYGLFHSGLLAVAPTGSTSMLLRTSPGIEPIFSVETQRVDRGVRRVIKDPLIGEYPAALFRTALEVSPKEHLSTLETVQKYVDGSVSKTVSLPESITKDDFDAFMRSVLIAKVKGLTIYRDKSLSGQVVSLDEPVTDAKIYRMQTPSGKVYVPIGRDANGRITQIFLHLHKPGSGESALASALGRVISIALQGGAQPERIIKTMQEIKSGEPRWVVFRGKRIPVLSVPDAVAHVMADAIGVLAPVSMAIPVNGGVMCPECGGVLMHVEGCTSCSQCSFSFCSTGK